MKRMATATQLVTQQDLVQALDIFGRKMAAQITDQVAGRITGQVASKVALEVTGQVASKVALEVTGQVAARVAEEVTDQVASKVAKEVIEVVREEFDSKLTATKNELKSAIIANNIVLRAEMDDSLAEQSQELTQAFADIIGPMQYKDKELETRIIRLEKKAG